MKLKNYASSSPPPNIFNDIDKTLTQHGAKQIVRDYDNGLVTGVAFVVPTHKGDLAIRLPARIDKVEALFKAQGIRYKPEQPYRTAWATLRDWVSSQMALIDWEMVKLEEVFLPYAVDKDGHTFFETIERRGFYLGDGDGDREN